MKSFLESKRWHHQSTFLPAIFPIKETKFEITLIHFPVKFPKRYFHRLWFDVFSAEKTFQSFYIGSKIHTNFHFVFLFRTSHSSWLDSWICVALRLIQQQPLPPRALPPQSQCSPIYLLKQCDDQLKDCLEMATNLTIAQEVVIDLLAEAMSKESTGFLVDGFPATIEQVGFTRCYLAVFQIFDSPTIDYIGGINDTGQFFWVFPLSYRSCTNSSNTTFPTGPAV